jgi:hypothetical protein
MESAIRIFHIFPARSALKNWIKLWFIGIVQWNL